MSQAKVLTCGLKNREGFDDTLSDYLSDGWTVTGFDVASGEYVSEAVLIFLLTREFG